MDGRVPKWNFSQYIVHPSQTHRISETRIAFSRRASEDTLSEGTERACQALDGCIAAWGVRVSCPPHWPSSQIGTGLPARDIRFLTLLTRSSSLKLLGRRASVQALRMSKAPGSVRGFCVCRSKSWYYCSTFPCIASVKNLPESVGVKSQDLIRAGSHSGS
jgi:hypothetical protein